MYSILKYILLIDVFFHQKHTFKDLFHSDFIFLKSGLFVYIVFLVPVELYYS